MTNATKYYELYIKRKNEDHLSIEIGENFTKLKSTWEKLHKEWNESISEKRPFVIESPVVTAFDPGLINEISLAPYNGQQNRDPENPYEAAMRKDGFGKSINNFNNLNQSLDQGYKED